MKLEIGKTYRDGLGDLWTCTDVDWVYSRPYRLHRNRGDLYEYFSEEGQYWTHDKSDKDMVEEVVENSVMKLEVGKWYKDREGNLWHVTGITNGVDYPFIAVCERHGLEERFPQDGSFFRELYEEHFWDLIEEVAVDTLTLEDGKYYTDADGDGWLVHSYDDPAPYDFFPYTGYRVKDNLSVNFSSSGKSWCGNYKLVKDGEYTKCVEESLSPIVDEAAPITAPQPDQELARLSEKFMLHYLSVLGWADEDDLDKITDLSVKAAIMLQGKLK